MKLIELCLYRLASKGVMSIEAAKVLYSIYKNRAGSAISLSNETGLEMEDVKFALSELKSIRMVDEAGVFYYAPHFEENLCSLIAENKNMQYRVVFATD